MKLRSLLAVLGCGAIAACSNTSSPDMGDMAIPFDATPVPDLFVRCPIQPSLLMLGADAGGAPIADDFTCPDGIDPTATTATMDYTGTGFARAAAASTLGDPGSGGEGAWPPTVDGGVPELVDGGAPVLSAGTHHFSSFTLKDGGAHVVGGDLVLDIAGPFTIGPETRLLVAGNLTIVVSGAILVGGGIYAGGDVIIEQSTDAGIVFGNMADSGYVYAGDTFSMYGLTTSTPGNIEISSRGSVTLPRGYMYASTFGSGASAQGGSIAIRAYGDIVLGSSLYGHTNSYLYAGGPCIGQANDACAMGANGNVRFFSEGTIRLDYGSFVYAGDTSRGMSGGDLSLRAVAGIDVVGKSFMYAGNTGQLELLSQGDVVFDDLDGSGNAEGPAFAYAGDYHGAGAGPTNIHVRAHSVSVKGASYLIAGGAGGAIAIEATGDVTFDYASYASGGNGACAKAGGITVRSEGNIAIADGSYLNGGNSTPGNGCPSKDGGDVSLSASGTITAPVISKTMASLIPGMGTPSGAVTKNMMTPVVVGLLDAQLEPSLTVTSIPMPASTTSLLYADLGGTVPPAFFGAHLLVSPDGTDGALLPAHYLLGSALKTGWRYQVLLQPRMFDASAADGVILRVQ